jgi:parallel beta-helix repeat protein
LEQSNLNLVSNNTIKKCSFGVEIFNIASQNDVCYNDIETRDTGIYIHNHSNNSSLFFNELDSTSIYISASNLNILKFNYIKTPDIGIILSYSNNSLILNNTIYRYNNKCISEYNCVNNTIFGNKCIPNPTDWFGPFETFLIIISILSVITIVIIVRIIKKNNNSS